MSSRTVSLILLDAKTVEVSDCCRVSVQFWLLPTIQHSGFCVTPRDDRERGSDMLHTEQDGQDVRQFTHYSNRSSKIVVQNKQINKDS